MTANLNSQQLRNVAALIEAIDDAEGQGGIGLSGEVNLTDHDGSFMGVVVFNSPTAEHVLKTDVS